MTSDAEQEGLVPPDDAFGVLGNETRVQILQALGEAEEPMSFTELRDRVGLRQGGQFNYHLEKIVGHFVKKTEEGYVLRQPGRRVVQAVLSGAVTDDPELDYTEVDEACWWCGGPIVVRYHQERLDLYCTECAGTYGDLSARRPTPIAETVPTVPDDLGYLGAFFLPPAGVETRTPEQAYRAGMAWEMLEYLAISNGICPRCSSAIDRAVQVCESHDETEGLCGTCGNRKAINMQVACRNCIYRNRGTFVDALYNDPEVMAFFTANGISLFSPYQLFSVSGWYDEEILSTDPFEARFTFTMGDETLTVTVDDTFSIVESVRS
jgi:DNA-binding transcriptional ArsR family regulator